MTSAGFRFTLPSPSLTSSIPHAKLKCRIPALPLPNGGINGRTTGGFDPLRLLGPAPPAVAIPLMRRQQTERRGGVVCYCAPLNPQTLQWVSAVSVAVLMFAKGTAIQKSFLVPLFALQAPASVISWIKGDYGTWTAFLALLVRLFYFVPGGLELPFLAMLLVIVAPYQTMNLRQSLENKLYTCSTILINVFYISYRGTQAGAIVSLAIAGYLAFQHFSRVGGLRKACDQGSIVATSAVVKYAHLGLVWFCNPRQFDGPI
ncbi:hypothetical protein MUK42_16990 [Musa troglodytarum]|uniref:Uncharacterized protein n=1 Tax=Musa troglodytarum TaxID=320322 RepID=A0A9E7KNP3_9LILI|nr:hypothetical protein MUK42_16990 [Musa troglodytarum]